MLTQNIAALVPAFLLVLILLVTTTAGAEQVQELEHDSAGGSFNSLVQVDADTYALAYSGNGGAGILKAFTISADGTTIIQVQELEHDPIGGSFNSLVQVDADTYALAYKGGDGFDGILKTFTISADGSTITQVQELEHDSSIRFSNSLVQVDADTYALAYTGEDGVGFLKTFTISADGTTVTEIQVLEHDTASGGSNSLVQVDADTYALAYTGEDGVGFLKTFTISADGTTITEIQALEHDPVIAGAHSLVQVDADTYALAYAGEDGVGSLKTFTISADGTAITEVQVLEHDTGDGFFNSLIQVDASSCALAYSGRNQDGFLKTFTISADGSTIAQVQELEHDMSLGFYNSLVQVDADTHALAYQANDFDGFIKTFTLSHSTVFSDGFESGDTMAWSATVR